MSPCKACTLLLFAWLLTGCGSVPHHASSSSRAAAQNPSDATYMIDGRSVVLAGGKSVIEVVPGAASQTVIEVSGAPVIGDLDHDGIADAVLLLVETTGGSGTFYHVAAAFNRDSQFVGTPAVLLGDRIVPQQLSIRYGVVIIDYLDRRPGEAMATPPSLAVSKYLIARAERLTEIPLALNEVIAGGDVVIGHEVRSFRPCGADDAAWLVGSSPALPAVQAAYYLHMSDASPYVPLFMVLTGQAVDAPTSGFGADYPAGFYATQLVHSLPGMSCSP